MKHNHDGGSMIGLLKAEAAMWKAAEKRLQDYLKANVHLLDQQKVYDSIMVNAKMSDIIFREIEQLEH